MMYFEDWWKSTSVEERCSRLNIPKNLASLTFDELDDSLLDLLVVAYRASEPYRRRSRR